MHSCNKENATVVDGCSEKGTVKFDEDVRLDFAKQFSFMMSIRLLYPLCEI
jgi:hypothetical protein